MRQILDFIIGFIRGLLGLPRQRQQDDPPPPPQHNDQER